MNRREFLKLSARSALFFTFFKGDISKVSAKENTKKRIVFYFTGTGNCLYVAKELGGDAISIPQALKKKELSYKAEEIGIVYPVYWGQPPQIVEQFIKEANLDAPYKFAIATYGMVSNATTEIFNNMTGKYHVPFDYITTLQMVDNYLPAFDMNNEIRTNKHEDENLAKIKKEIEAHKKWHEPVSTSDRIRRKSFEENGVIPYPVNSENILTVTDTCIGCGICTQVCPKKNFEIVNSKAVNSGDCEYCLACAHACPQKAIVIKQGERNPNARYRHNGISLVDIIKANNQL